MIVALLLTFTVVIGVVMLTAAVIWSVKEDLLTRPVAIAIVTVMVILAVAFCGGAVWWLNCTESGKRVIKDTKSDISGGIERTVTVYDFDGDVIETYSGKFDVDYDSDRIKFDDENGKRHVIYYTTGTVIIDED